MQLGHKASQNISQAQKDKSKQSLFDEFYKTPNETLTEENEAD